MVLSSRRQLAIYTAAGILDLYGSPYTPVPPSVSPLPCYSTPCPFSGPPISTPFSLSSMVVKDHGIVCWVCNFPLYK